MASYHKHAPWRKAILVPFWIIQLILQVLMIALLALAVGILVSWQNSNTTVTLNGNIITQDSFNRATRVIVPIWMTMVIICLVLTITEIVMLARHTLKPLVFVIMGMIKSIIWTVIFIIDVVSMVHQSSSRLASAISIFIEAVLLLCYYLPLIYGSIIYHRERLAAGTYKPVDGISSFPVMPTEYTGAGTTISTYPEKYKAFVVQEDVDIEAQPTPGRPRRLSYNHQRDTRFDSFRQDRDGFSGYGDLGNSPTESRGGSRSGSLSSGLGMGSPTGMMSPPPVIHIENHDEGVFEMVHNNRRSI